MSKSNAQAILLNKNFFSALNHKKFLKEHGPLAVLILQDFWIESSKEPSCKVKKEDVGLLDLHFDIEEIELINLLDSAVKYKLLNFEKGFYFNSQTIENQESYKTKSTNISKARQETERKKRESSENPPTILPESLDESGRTPNIISNNIILDNNNSKKEVAPGKIQPGDLKILEFDQIQWEALSIQNDKTTLERAILLAESYIDKHKKKDPQRYRELCDEAKSGKSYLLSWPISEAMKQIKNEGAAQARLDKAKQPYQKPEEAPRVQPKIFKPPPKQPPLTEAQKAENKRKVAELISTISTKKKVA